MSYFPVNQQAMPLSTALPALLGLTWIEARRSQLIPLLLLLVLVVESLAWFMGAIAITESSEAGADPVDVQRLATHTQASTTGRYIRRTRASTSNVAVLRVAKREREKNRA